MVQNVMKDWHVPDSYPIDARGAAYSLAFQIGTRYLFTACRTLLDTANPADVKKVHALQDAVKATQPGGPGRLEVARLELWFASTVHVPRS
jgi:hypothetical protein